jgi:hypothetical protein
MRAVLLLALLTLAPLTQIAVAQGLAADPLASWVTVLQRFVNEHGEVDFQGLATDPGELKAFVNYVGTVSPDSAPSLFPTREAKLAYHINAYNALSMYNVIESGIPKSLSGLIKVRFFGLKRFQIGGTSMSLYRYENDVIRPLGDERVHFALNCMSVGCPRLPRMPFLPEKLNDQLEQEARKFFGEPRNLEVLPEKRVVRLSEILKFYKEDFLAHSPTLIAYVNRYVNEKIPEEYRVEFVDYDWTINDQNRLLKRVPGSDDRVPGASSFGRHSHNLGEVSKSQAGLPTYPFLCGEHGRDAACGRVQKQDPFVLSLLPLVEL